MKPFQTTALICCTVSTAFAQHGADIACIIVEPVAGNMNLIKPAPG